MIKKDGHTPHPQHWRQKLWALDKRKYKQASPASSGQDYNWEENKRKYDENPEAFIDEIRRILEQQRQLILSQIKSGAVFVAADSKDAKTAEMQKEIDTMSEVAGHLKPPKVLGLPDEARPFLAPPKLLVHRLASRANRLAQTQIINASVDIPEFIDVNISTKDYFLERPKQFKAAMAHELAHIANFDVSPEGLALWRASPPNQMREILAEKLAAILHGNPMEYARESSKFQFRVNKKNKTPNDEFSDQYLSANENARMQHKWAEILQREGALDAEGNVILEPDDKGHMMPLRALAILDRAREFTEGYLSASLAVGVSHPLPSKGR